MRALRSLRVTVPLLSAGVVLTLGASMAAAQAATSARDAEATQAIDYQGYHADVPASWPVYDLASEPTRCVRYDQHAVYLGRAGADQLCPPHVMGRTEALHVEPATKSSVAAAAADKADVADAQVTDSGTLSAIVGSVLVTASYGDNRASMQRYVAPGDDVAQARPVSPQVDLPAKKVPEGAKKITPPTAPGDTSGAQTQAQTSAFTPTSASGSTINAVAATAHVATATGRAVPHAQTVAADAPYDRAFDACSAPSISTMRKWWPDPAPYSVAGIYIGGPVRGCGYGNLNPTWVKQAQAIGWRFIPIYVGRQAPCTSRSWSKMSTNASTAAAQGRAEGDSAIADAKWLGFGTGNPIYFDIEGYSSTASCRRSVLGYVSAMTNRLHGRGYYSGVYSSGSSGIRDIANNYYNRSYVRTDIVWNAHWDGSTNAYNDRYVANGIYVGRRVKQYRGGQNETHGGATLNVDANVVDAPVGVLGTRGKKPSAAPKASQARPTPKATGWTVSGGMSLGGSSLGGPAAVTQTSRKINAVVRGKDGRYYYKSSGNGGASFGPFHVIPGGRFTAEPAVESWADGRLDVMGRGRDGKLWHTYYSKAKWHKWDRINRSIVGTPAIVAQRKNSLNAVYRGTDNQLKHLTWTGKAWKQAANIGGRVSSSPSITSWGSGRLDLAVRAGGSKVFHKYWTRSGGWSRWENLGGTTLGRPAIVSTARGNVDVYIRGKDNALWHRWFSDRWSGWQGLGGRLTSQPSAIAPRAAHLDVVFRGSKGELRYRYYNGS